MIFLLELLQPAVTVGLEMAIRVAHGRSKETGLIPDDRIIER